MTFVQTLGLHRTIFIKTLPQKSSSRLVYGLALKGLCIFKTYFKSRPACESFFFVPLYQRFLQIHVPLTTSKNLSLPRKAHHLTNIIRMYQNKFSRCVVFRILTKQSNRYIHSNKRTKKGHFRSKWKALRLDLLECREWSLATEALPVDGHRMTALTHYERQRGKKVNFFAKKHFVGLCFNMFKRCACPVSLTCIHTQHQACDVVWLAVETLPIAGMIAPPAKIYAGDRSRSMWNMKQLPANRTRLFAAPVQCNRYQK